MCVRVCVCVRERASARADLIMALAAVGLIRAGNGVGQLLLRHAPAAHAWVPPDPLRPRGILDGHMLLDRRGMLDRRVLLDEPSSR